MSGLRLAASNIGWSAADDGRVLTLMASLGFEGLEIAPTRVIEDDPYAHCNAFATWAERVHAEHGLKICSMQSIWRGRNESIFDAEGAKALLAHTRRACEFAKVGGVRNLVFGCPRNRNVPEGREPAEAVPFLVECGRMAAAAGTTFALEANPPIYSTNFLNATTDAIAYLEGELGQAKGLGINLDVGTMIAMDEGVDVAARALPFVSHVHVSEPGLVPVEPRPLHRELASLLANADYEGFVSLEMGTSDYETVARCLEYVAKTFMEQGR